MLACPQLSKRFCEIVFAKVSYLQEIWDLQNLSVLVKGIPEHTILVTACVSYSGHIVHVPTTILYVMQSRKMCLKLYIKHFWFSTQFYQVFRMSHITETL